MQKSYELAVNGLRYDLQIRKTHEALPDLDVDEVQAIVNIIATYWPDVPYGWDVYSVRKLHITLNNARNKNYCAYDRFQGVANIQVDYIYPCAVRMFLLAHELTHALFPLTETAYYEQQNIDYQNRPAELFANCVASQVSGITEVQLSAMIRNTLLERKTQEDYNTY